MASQDVHPRTKIGCDSAGLLMTPAEFDSITHFDRRFRYELIREVVVVSRYPLPPETDINEELGRLLRNYQADHPQGSIIDLTLGERYIYLPNSRRRAARAVWVGLGRVPDIEKDIPAIAIEFVSRGKRDFIRDYEEKRNEYLALGIREYWIIDRFRRAITVHLRTQAGYAEKTLDENQVYRTDLLPGFELPLGHLLAKTDRWKLPRKPG